MHFLNSAIIVLIQTEFSSLSSLYVQAYPVIGHSHALQDELLIQNYESKRGPMRQLGARGQVKVNESKKLAFLCHHRRN